MFNAYGAVIAYNQLAAAARSYRGGLMKERITEKAAIVLELAADYHCSNPHAPVEEAFLVGLLQEGSGVGAKALRLHGIVEEDFVAANSALDEFDFSVPAEGGVTEVEAFLTHCWDQARKLGHAYISTEHIALAVATSAHGRDIFAGLGIEAEAIESTIFGLLR